MSSVLTRIRRRPGLAAAALLGYLAVAGGYLMLARHESGVWQAKRQRLIEQSPAVWVAPYGAHYHEERHYGRHLSSPLSLYEATERGYGHCDVCRPPAPAALSVPPAWVRHRGVGLAALSCLWALLTAGVLYKIDGGTWRRRPPDLK
jgi:hypothetical protein